MSFREAWYQLWFKRVDPLAPALFRISAGILITLIFLFLYPNWSRYYALDGVSSLIDKTIKGYPDDAWSIFYWLDPYVPFQAFWWIAILASLAFTAGFQTRAATIILYLMFASTIHRNRMAINGEDMVYRMLLFYGCFFHFGRTLSVDAWLARRKNKPIDTPDQWSRIWPVRCMQIQIAAVYFISLPHKMIDDNAWYYTGEAIYLSQINSLWSRLWFPSLFYGGVLSWIGTLGTVVVEGLFPFLVWFRRTRLWVVLGLAGMHIGIAVLLANVTFFSLSMVSAYWLYFSAEELRGYRDRALRIGKGLFKGSSGEVIAGPTEDVASLTPITVDPTPAGVKPRRPSRRRHGRTA